MGERGQGGAHPHSPLTSSPPTPLTGPAPAVGEVQAPQPTDDLPVHLRAEGRGTMGAALRHGAPTTAPGTPGLKGGGGSPTHPDPPPTPPRIQPLGQDWALSSIKGGRDPGVVGTPQEGQGP